MVDGNGRNEILSNNSFYLQLVNGGNFFATPFISKSLSVKLFPGRNEIYARGKWRESVRDVDENFLARSFHTMIASLNPAKPSCTVLCWFIVCLTSIC